MCILADYVGDEMNTIDKILLTLAGFIFGFTVTMIVLFCIFQVTPDTLIECVFACCSSEAVITFAIWWIKKKANRKDKDNDREVKEP